MKTVRLYQDDRYIREWEATVTSVSQICDSEASFIVTLDQSAFFPEGGGQSCDLGMIGSLTVTDVQEKDGEVYHTVRAEAAGTDDSGSASPVVGQCVLCTLDWSRRFDNMQRHCGEHILSGIFFSMFGGVNRGFHMGHDYMTIDISLE